MTIRLSLFLSRAGIASRRTAGDMVKEGRVKVNGKINTNPAVQIDGKKDHVRVNGKLIKKLPPAVYLILNKPKGILTAREDPEGRPTVFDLLGRVKVRVEAVGRLDRDTQGILLFTNDGALAQKLSRPASKVEKVYEALVKGRPSRASLESLARGVVLDGRKTLPAQVKTFRKTKENNTWLRLTIVEGRNRQIKRMCLAIGHPVKKLKRVAFGPLEIGDLEVGKIRFLNEREVEKLRCEKIP